MCAFESENIIYIKLYINCYEVIDRSIIFICAYTYLHRFYSMNLHSGSIVSYAFLKSMF